MPPKNWNVVKKMLMAPTSNAYYSKLGKAKSGLMSGNRFWHLSSFWKLPSSKSNSSEILLQMF